MKKGLTCIFLFILCFTNLELFGCLENDINLIKQQINNLYAELSDLDEQIMINEKQLDALEVQINNNKEQWARLFIKRKELQESGNIIVRSLETLFMKLTELKKLPLPWDFITEQAIAKILDDINNYTLKLNVFNRQIAGLDEKIAVFEDSIKKLKIEIAVLEVKNNGFKAEVDIKENQQQALKLNLGDKFTEIADVEEQINKVNRNIDSYYNSIKILQSRIDELSSMQQGSMVPNGMNQLLSALALQRRLLADALKKLEELHFEHGC